MIAYTPDSFDPTRATTGASRWTSAFSNLRNPAKRNRTNLINGTYHHAMLSIGMPSPWTGMWEAMEHVPFLHWREKPGTTQHPS